MILLGGIPSETPLRMVREALDDLGHPYVLFNQREFDAAGLEFTVDRGRVTGLLRLSGVSYHLEDISGLYLRFMDDQRLPELAAEPAGSVRRQYCRNLHDAIVQWSELMPGRVVNRFSNMGSNSSKPYQAQLIAAQGLSIPETLVTNDPERVITFRAHHGKVIFKSTSGARSIVKTLEDSDMHRLNRIRWCPVQFQAFVDGFNVRVHVIGTTAFATAIETGTIDYRYADQLDGTAARLRTYRLPEELMQKCVNLAQALGLAFAGIDLKVTPGGEVYCFEVNPMPAFSYYEAHTGQPIARAVAEYLNS
jgi:hypothetical protein